MRRRERGVCVSGWANGKELFLSFLFYILSKKRRNQVEIKVMQKLEKKDGKKQKHSFF